MKEKSYLQSSSGKSAAIIIKAIDRDVERGEDLLMFGFCTVMLSSSFAPIFPPTVLLPAVALVFGITGGLARMNYHRMEAKLINSMLQLEERDLKLLAPIASVFKENPMPTLAESYNPLKDVKRTMKSILGGILINPLWMPIFFMMGIHMKEERNLNVLNRAIIGVEQRMAGVPSLIEKSF